MTIKSIAQVKPPSPLKPTAIWSAPLMLRTVAASCSPCVMADGATEFEAIADGREAFIATFSAMVDMGQEIPVPAFNAEDFTPASASGKVLARLPRSMHMQLTARAKTEGVSLNA